MAPAAPGYLSFARLLDDPKSLAANLRAYIGGFSPGAAEVLEKYRFDEQITRLDQAGLLYLVLSKFADLDLHPDVVPNHAMGYLFEELLRRFSELSNETAGEHFTPREVIRLIVNVLFSEDTEVLIGISPVRSIYDPACGTGGMLNISDQHVTGLNSSGRLEMFGQELNPETWAIARSDLLIQGQDPERIVLGNSLSDDGHPDRASTTCSPTRRSGWTGPRPPRPSGASTRTTASVAGTAPACPASPTAASCSSST